MRTWPHISPFSYSKQGPKSAIENGMSRRMKVGIEWKKKGITYFLQNKKMSRLLERVLPCKLCGSQKKNSFLVKAFICNISLIINVHLWEDYWW